MSRRSATQRPYFLVCAAIVFLSLGSCGKPLSQGAYRVKIEDVASNPNTMVRRYLIETSSLRKLILADQTGATTNSIGPIQAGGETTKKAEATVTVTLRGSEKDAHVDVEIIVQTHSVTNGAETTTTARCEETLPTPSATDLKSVLTETRPVGHLTSKTTLLRVASGDDHLDVVIE